ncbi:helix-turn-helix transcriptional regulator, partial [Streptomyces sp. SID3343]|uniref:helix-turn-helix domain-containing protein n=1 Tax=Streptomyces sp. SID3343 TaxID=2690260 RepID=UPI00136D9B4E
MDTDNHFGTFLRARREVLAVEDVGVLHSGRRRTPGLRREEVALLAGVSTDYYVRLEQGRERNPSDQVVDALAAALRLNDEEAGHLR